MNIKNQDLINTIIKATLYTGAVAVVYDLLSGGSSFIGMSFYGSFIGTILLIIGGMIFSIVSLVFSYYAFGEFTKNPTQSSANLGLISSLVFAYFISPTIALFAVACYLYAQDEIKKQTPEPQVAPQPQAAPQPTVAPQAQVTPEQQATNVEGNGNTSNPF